MCSSRCVTTWEICATTVVTELENGTQKQEERTKNRRNAITTVLSRSSCNCSDDKRMRVALWVRVFASWLFDGKHWDMGERNMENQKQGQERHSCRWEKGCSTNSVSYPMGTSCDTHGTAAESCWWHIHFTGLHLVDMSGYVLPCLASFTTHQTCAATCVCCAIAPPVPSVTEPQVHTALPSPSSLLVVLVLKTRHRLPGHWKQ